MKKIIVIGCPGSGKSFFTRQLSEKLNIDKYYLDCLYWLPNWENRSKEEFISLQKEIFNKESWIIDGTFFKTLEMRFQEADTVFFLDIDENICIESENKRRGLKREDLPEYLVEEYDPDFINYILDFKNKGKLIILDLIKKYPQKDIIIFKTREEKDEFINSI